MFVKVAEPPGFGGLIQVCRLKILLQPWRYKLPNHGKLRIIGWKPLLGFFFLWPVKVFDVVIDFPLEGGIADYDPIGALWLVYGEIILKNKGQIIGVFAPPGSGFWDESGALLANAAQMCDRAGMRFF